MLPEQIFPKKLIILIGTFVLIIIVGFFALQKPLLTFTESPDKSIKQMISGNSNITAEKAIDIINKKDQGFLFVDIRDPYEFIKGHIIGAENFPLQELLNKEYLKKFKTSLRDSIKIVLYGKDESSVNGAVQILRQSGFSNILSLEGGFIAYQRIKDGIKADSIPRNKAEAHWYDYKSFMKQVNTAETAGEKTTTVKTITPKKATVKASASKSEGC